MADKMVIFEQGEFEIALVTYNRCEFIAEWLERCYEPVRKRGIHFSIYDSSTNDETEKYIIDFKTEKGDADIEYYHVDSDIHIGYKPMLPLLHSRSKYVWVAGDSRCSDLDVMDEKVFPYLKQDIDCAVLHILKNDENDGKIYTDREEFFRDCYDSVGVIGLVIYKTALFEPLKNNTLLRTECDRKYKDNWFAWMGYFFEMFALEEHKAVFAVVPLVNIKPDKKTISWISKYYGCWIEGSCDLMDGLADSYSGTETVLRNAWKYSAQDIPLNQYIMRKNGDLNKETYKKYKENGMLERCTRQVGRMERFANASDEELEEVLEREKEIEKEEFRELCCRSVGKIESMLRECQGGRSF